MSEAERDFVNCAARAMWIIQRASTFLRACAEPAGTLRCPVHRVEHVGKVAYLLRIGKLLEDRVAADLARRLAGTLRAHPQQADAWVFGPGPTQARNLANWVVDSASVAAGLAAWMRQGGEDAGVRAALQLCARSYLLPAARTKSVLPQRAWALWGLAEAARALEDDALACASEEALQELLGCQAADGSWRYDAAEHVAGTASSSVFYHSRVMGFALRAAAVLGFSLDRCSPQIELAARWLAAVLFPDGAKAARPEAKPWYFPAGCEDVSAPFDVMLLLPAALHLRDASWARLVRARLARAAVCFEPARHVAVSARGGGAFQCSFFFAAHALLLAEWNEDAWQAIDDLADAPQRENACAALGWDLVAARGAPGAPTLARWRGDAQHALWSLEPGSAGALHGNEQSGMLAGRWSLRAGTHWKAPRRDLPTGFGWRVPKAARMLRRASAQALLRAEWRFALHLLRMPREGRAARWSVFYRAWRTWRGARGAWQTTARAKLQIARVDQRRLHLRWLVCFEGAEAPVEGTWETTLVATRQGYVCRERIHIPMGLHLPQLRFVPPRDALRVRGPSRVLEVRGPARFVVRYTLQP